MNNELIERARELAQAATPGPWTVEENYVSGLAPERPGERMEMHVVVKTHGPDFVSYPNAAFIAASRELVPALCDALEAAQVQVTDLRGEIEHLKHPFHMEPGKMSDAFINALLASNDEAIRAQKQEIEAAQAENARLREALHHIGYQSASMSSVDFDWHNEWRNLRNEARAALEPRP